jgi:hypothetical protein
MEGFVFGLAIFVTVGQLPKLFGLEKMTCAGTSSGSGTDDRAGHMGGTRRRSR